MSVFAYDHYYYYYIIIIIIILNVICRAQFASMCINLYIMLHQIKIVL